MREQSSGCSACNQLGQVPTPEHLAGVARFEARQQAATNAESLEAENARLRALTTTLLEWKVCARHADQVAVATARARQWQRNNEFPWLGWQLCEGCLHDDLAAFIAGNPDATTLATKLKEARDGALTAALGLVRLRERVAALDAHRDEAERMWSMLDDIDVFIDPERAEEWHAARNRMDYLMSDHARAALAGQEQAGEAS